MKQITYVILAAVIGLINAIIFVVFEYIVNEGTLYLWNDILHTDTIRWLVIPVTLILSIVYSLVLRAYSQKRLGDFETNIFEDVDISKTTIGSIIAIFVIGAVSLVAGASLGPEAPLIGIATGLGILLTQRYNDQTISKIFIASSVGALLVAFFSSLFPILLPIFMLYKKEKKLHFTNIVLPIIAGVCSYIGLLVIKGPHSGFGTLSTHSDIAIHDLVIAFLLGIVGSVCALALKKCIVYFGSQAERLEKSSGWLMSSILFGTILGTLYLVGGFAIQFNGRGGTEYLLQNAATYTVPLLVVVVLTKTLATAWSLGTGYRGGIVFPSAFIAVTLGVLFGKIDPSLAGSGIVIGSVSGIMATLLSPVVGFILILAMIPFKLSVVALAGFIGAVCTIKLSSKYGVVTETAKNTHKT